MLSYQHSYHAGNLADVHKHAVLASVIGYLTQKDKPLSYLETHSGRGLYDLQSDEARKTGESDRGIARAEVLDWFAVDHPYRMALEAIRLREGPTAYGGSPLVASELLRSSDRMHLAELHPQEYSALVRQLGRAAHIYQEDGFALANRLCPPTPRRGLLLIDPSYEHADEYGKTAKAVEQVMMKWNVGVVLVWYPILASGAEQSMVRELTRSVPEGIHHQVHFSPAKAGHGLIGSGLFMVRPPFGVTDELTRLSRCFMELCNG